MYRVKSILELHENYFRSVVHRAAYITSPVEEASKRTHRVLCVLTLGEIPRREQKVNRTDAWLHARVIAWHVQSIERYSWGWTRSRQWQRRRWYSDDLLGCRECLIDCLRTSSVSLPFCQAPRVRSIYPLLIWLSDIVSERVGDSRSRCAGS